MLQRRSVVLGCTSVRVCQDLSLSLSVSSENEELGLIFLDNWLARDSYEGAPKLASIQSLLGKYLDASDERLILHRMSIFCKLFHPLRRSFHHYA